MRRHVSILLTLLVVSCVVSAHLWLELRKERNSTTAALATSVDQRFGKASESHPSLPSTTTAAASETDAPELTTPDQQSSSATRVELLRDPAYRKARLAQVRMNQVRRNPGLSEALGLSEIEASRLFDLLAEEQLNTNVALNELALRGLDAATFREERARILDEGRRRRDELLQVSLGSARYAQWQTYHESLPYRPEAGEMLQGMLSSEDRSGLGTRLQTVITAAAVEQSRYEKDVQSAMDRHRSSESGDLVLAQTELLNLRDESNRRLLDAMASHLSPEQLMKVRDSFERDSERARARLQGAHSQGR